MTFDNIKEIPRTQWKTYPSSEKRRLNCWAGDTYIVQLFKEPKNRFRIQVGRHDEDDCVSWDDIQACKAAIGFGDVDALEVYPRDKDVVNLGNFRHLWILDTPLDFPWRADGNIEQFMKRYVSDYAGCVGLPR
jgi:hypothetical protein